MKHLARSCKGLGIYAKKNIAPLTQLTCCKGLKTPVSTKFAMGYSSRLSLVEVEEDNSYFFFSGPASFVNGSCILHANAHALYEQEFPILHTGDTIVNANEEILIMYNEEPIITKSQAALCPIPGCLTRIFTVL